MSMIRVENLFFDYPTKRALFGLDTVIERGTITALVGPNGAGKTTLIRCLAALERPNGGRVLFDGEDVHDAPRSLHRRIGYLADVYGLYEELSVRRSLAYAAASQGMPAGERTAAVERAAERLKIADRLGEKVSALSRGLKQRTAIAQAIVHDPEFLILDEPAAGLDPDARYRLARLFRELQEAGMTLLVSSHILAELEDYATHLIVIREGRIAGTRAMGDVGTEESPRRVLVKLAAPDDRLDGRLHEMEGVSSVRVDGRYARFQIIGTEARLGAVLADLIGAGFAVVEFHEETERLQDAYMATASDEAGRGAAP